MGAKSLGRRGGSTQHRSLLQSHTIRIMLASNSTQAQSVNQTPAPPPARNETGQGMHTSSSIYMHRPDLKTSISMA